MTVTAATPAKKNCAGMRGTTILGPLSDRPMIVLAAGTGIIAIATTGILDMSKGMVTMKAYAA